MSPDQVDPAATPAVDPTPTPEVPAEPVSIPVTEAPAPAEQPPAPDPAPAPAPEPVAPPKRRAKPKAAAKKVAQAAAEELMVEKHLAEAVKDLSPEEEVKASSDLRIDGSNIGLQTTNDFVANLPKNAHGQVEIDENGKIVGL